MPKFRNHYDTLKVSRDAPAEVIQGAYRSLARKYHPDVAGGSPEGEARMKALNEAYEVLGDPVKRAEYDRWLDSSGGLPRRAADGRGTRRPPSVDTVLMIVCYVLLTLFLLRVPGYPRLAGIVMIGIGLGYLQMRARR
jgi:preprotein translocase subunit Sec63